MTSDAADPDVIALGCADDLKLWHGCTLSTVFNIETTREERQIDSANYFLGPADQFPSLPSQEVTR
jgi:hypothetical protein